MNSTTEKVDKKVNDNDNNYKKEPLDNTDAKPRRRAKKQRPYPVIPPKLKTPTEKNMEQYKQTMLQEHGINIKFR